MKKMIFIGKLEESVFAKRISLNKNSENKYEAFLIKREPDETKEADLRQRVFKDIYDMNVPIEEIDLSTVTDIPRWLFELKGFVGESISGEGLWELAELMNNEHFQERRLNNEHDAVDKLRDQKGICIKKKPEKIKKRR